MSMRFVFRPIRIGHQVISLGGRWVRPRPLVSVGVVGPTGTKALDATLDTSADDTVFPESVAVALGIDLSNTPTALGSGFGSRRLLLRFVQVHLRLTDGREQREWPAWIGFTAARLVYPSLGFAGCLQFFTSTFRGDIEEVELEVNSLYPGT